MCAGKHQRETMVGYLLLTGCVRRSGIEPFQEALQLFGCDFAAAPPPGEINHLSPGDGQQPAFRVRRAAIQGPICQCGSERLRQRVFGTSHVPCTCSEKGDELAVTAARDRVRSVTGLRVACVGAHTLDATVHSVRSTSPRLAAPRRHRELHPGNGLPRRARHPDRRRR